VDRKIVLFEINEVPYRVLDDYCKRHPSSALARQLPLCAQYESWSDDEIELSPWITWPTLHRGVTFARHGIQHFGQDLRAVDERYPPVWKLLVDAGLRVGVFGSLHSAPMPQDGERYAFYMPDTFAATAEAHPAPLSAFQDFNLSMARASARTVSKDVQWGAGLRLLPQLPSLGIRPGTLVDVAGQLASERRRPWLRVRRRTYQSVLGFDVFMKQIATTLPDFATFFTNHVASSMHRYWAAAFPGDYATMDYDDEWRSRWRDEIDFAMGKLDAMFERLVRFVDAHPEYLLLTASSMGQAATETKVFSTHLFMADLDRFMGRLGLVPGDYERRPAMEPDVNVMVAPAKVDGFRARLETLLVDEQPFGFREKDGGFFNLVVAGTNLHTKPPFAVLGGERVSYEELGLANMELEDEAGGCAYHVPEGVLLAYDPARRRGEPERRRVRTTELAPFLLSHLGVPVPPYMDPRTALDGAAAGARGA
jgi:hypothetical protein